VFIAVALVGVGVAVRARVDDWKGGAAVLGVGPLVGLLARPWVRQVAGFALVVLTVVLFILNLRRTAERAGHAAEPIEMLEHSDAIHRQCWMRRLAVLATVMIFLTACAEVNFGTASCTCPQVVA